MKYLLNALIAIMAFGMLTVAMPEIAIAGSIKVEVCHIPPGNPDNYHTIRISENALPAHLAHGDLGGSCNALCDDFCDDNDACTIDHNDDCEQNGCAENPEAVDCSDNDLCTNDECDPGTGCFNPTSVTCDPPDICTNSACVPSLGVCEDTPILCDNGVECNPDYGMCGVLVGCSGCFNGMGSCFDDSNPRRGRSCRHPDSEGVCPIGWTPCFE